MKSQKTAINMKWRRFVSQMKYHRKFKSTRNSETAEKTNDTIRIITNVCVKRNVITNIPVYKWKQTKIRNLLCHAEMSCLQSYVPHLYSWHPSITAVDDTLFTIIKDKTPTIVIISVIFDGITGALCKTLGICETKNAHVPNIRQSERNIVVLLNRRATGKYFWNKTLIRNLVNISCRYGNTIANWYWEDKSVLLCCCRMLYTRSCEQVQSHRMETIEDTN